MAENDDKFFSALLLYRIQLWYFLKGRGIKYSLVKDFKDDDSGVGGIWYRHVEI